MADYYARGRRNALIAGLAVVFLALGYCFVLQPYLAKQDADRKATAARSAEYDATVKCMEANSFPLKKFFAENVNIDLAEANCRNNTYNSAGGNTATIEAGLNTCEYKYKQSNISHTTQFCNQWVLCSRSASYETSFDRCYEVFSPSDDNDGPDADSSDTDDN